VAGVLVKVMKFCFNQMREELLDQLSNCIKFGQLNLPNGTNKSYGHVNRGK